MSLTLPADAPPWAIVLFDEVRSLRQVIATKGAPVEPMKSARSCDIHYRLRAGTAKVAFEAGKIRGQWRRGRSSTGQVLWLNTADADLLWGGG